MAAAAAGGWFLLEPGMARATSIAVLPFANLSETQSGVPRVRAL